MGKEYVSIAVGTNFPDAVAGGALTGGWGGVMLLTPQRSLSPQAAAHIARTRTTLRWIDVFGGKDTVWPHVIQDAFDQL
jgi:endo-alpha-N-acetylgalactosaminidase